MSVVFADPDPTLTNGAGVLLLSVSAIHIDAVKADKAKKNLVIATSSQFAILRSD